MLRLIATYMSQMERFCWSSFDVERMHFPREKEFDTFVVCEIKCCKEIVSFEAEIRGRCWYCVKLISIS